MKLFAVEENPNGLWRLATFSSQIELDAAWEDINRVIVSEGSESECLNRIKRQRKTPKARRLADFARDLVDPTVSTAAHA